MDFEKLLDRDSIEPAIWNVSISYFDVDWKDEKHPSGQSNYTSWPYFPSDKTETEIKEVFNHLFIKSLMKKDKQIPTTWEISVVKKGNHKWWLKWFAHETNQRFETEAEALKDFDDWYHDVGLFRWVDFAPAGSHVNDNMVWCPMGAEDYWRRKACDCKDCSENGIRAITH